MASSLKPLHDRVVIEPVEAEEKTASGIVLPDTATEKPNLGMVIAVGNGKILNDGTVSAMSVKPGDKVMFGKYSGQETKISGKKCIVMHESDIWGIVS
jgi:chaperonin GroES